MSRPVLCAVDTNEAALDAGVLRTAAKLAALDGAALDVITVLPDYGSSVVASFFSAEHHDKMVTEAKGKLKAICTEVLGAEADTKVRHIVATGGVYQEVLAAARAAGSGLIVIGAHKPDFKDYLLGPNAAHLVRHAECSVFVVRS